MKSVSDQISLAHMDSFKALAKELLGAETPAAATEAVRGFLNIAASAGLKVDGAGRLHGPALWDLASLKLKP